MIPFSFFRPSRNYSVTVGFAPARMAEKRTLGFVGVCVFVFASAFFLAGVLPAHAAVVEQAPVIDGFFEDNPAIGGGAILPLAKFRLSQASGSDTLTKIGVTLVASSTMANGSISRISLWKESGTTPGFQLDSDTFIAGAASTTITTGLFVILQPTTGETITSSGTEFYVIASTTAVSGLTNGHGFNVQMDANYASTSASTGVGSAFLSNRKVSLNQSGTVKISEVKIGTALSGADEFIELYNSGEADINLADLPLRAHSFYANGSSTPGISLTYYRKVIPSHGYFLIANQFGYSGTAQPDAVLATSTSSVLIENGGISLATSTLGSAATSTAIDFVGWGSQPITSCENVEASSTPCVLSLLENGASIERHATGYPYAATSTAASLASGGAHATKGNGFDKNFNKTDFVAQTIANPQNSSSPIEFPFGGGGSDTSSLQVQASYPTNGQTGFPVDARFVGFNLNKPANSDTIASASATTTITFFKVANNGHTGSNLCSNVLYNPMPGNFEPQAKCNLSGSLEPSTSYVFTVTSAVRDLSGNSLDQDSFTSGNQNYYATSTTGSAGQTFTNVTPPTVVGTSPINGSTNIPSNLASIAIEFSTDMKPSTLIANSTITLANPSGTAITLSNLNFSTSTGKNVLTVVPGALSANTVYSLLVNTSVQSANSIGLPATYTSRFTTGSSADATAPTIIGVLPTNGTTIAANTSDFVVIFDDAMDTSTATSGAITLGITSGPNLPGSVRYDPVSKEVHFVPSNILPVGQALTMTLVGNSLKNASGLTLGSNVTKTWTVEASNTDTTPPAVLFVNADEFSIAITFNEAVNSIDATNLSNYSMVVGGVTQTPSALAGHSVTYDASTRTAKLTGLRLTSGASITATVQNIKDVSGNIMTAAVSSSATVNASTGSGGTGGMIGPGSFSGSTFGERKDFSASGIGFMPPVNIRPSSTFISASSTYAFDLPLSKQINQNGTIVITFPSSADFGLCCAATTSAKNPFLAEMNKDINGPSPSGDGSDTTLRVGIKTITISSIAKTVTITLDNPTRSQSGDAHDFLKFSLADVRNPSIPKGIDGSGYSLDIKSKSSSGTLLESFTANPVYIGGGSQGGGSTTRIRGTVSGNGGNLQGVSIHLISPQTGPMDAETDSNGFYQFTDLPVGSQFLSNNFGGGNDYMLFTDPFINPTGTSTAFFGNTMPTPVQATSTSFLTRDFSLTATSSAVNFTVNLTAAANTFTASETVDVFAGGPGQFIVRTVTPGASALTNSTLTTIPIPQTNGFWGIGIGPAMPKGTGGGFSGPPPSPNWAVPKPIEVTVSGCPSACSTAVSGTATSSNNFTISTADKTIAGVLRDGSGNAIANAEVFAFSPGGIGNHAQTSTTGVFQVKVVSGSYVVGAFVPGMGKSKEIPVVVDSSGNVFVDGSQTASASFTLTMTKPDYTISGQVTDGTNAVGNAPVFAYRTDAPGHSDAVTDSSTGNYTMYVDNGTWKVNSFIPGFGPMSEQTVTVSGSNQSNINFAPSSSASFSLYSGNIYDDADNNSIFATSTEGLVGAVIRLSGSSGVNEGVSGAQGAFSIRVPSGSGYTITDIFMPGYGRIAPLNNAGTAIGTLNLTASSSENYIRVPKRNTITINIKDSSGNLLVAPKAFIDLFNTTTKQGSHVELTNASSTTILVATGTSPAVRAFVQGVSPANVSVASDSDSTAVSGGVVTIDNATEAIKVVVNTSTASFSTVLGVVYHTAATSGNELEDAWIQFIDDTNGVSFGAQASTSGRYNVKASNGTYSVIVSKSGYVGPTQTVTVSGNTAQNFVLTSASQTISGTVTAGGSAAKDAFVRAEKVGGGQAITQTDTSGAFTLKVTSGSWKVYAAADGYAEGAAAGNPIASGTSGVTVTLATTVSLQSKLATSNTFTDTAAGTFKDSTVGVNIELDSNALGASGNSSYITAKETSNFPNTASVNIVASKAKNINAYSGGSKVKDLKSGKTATVDLTYTKAELAQTSIDTTTEVSNLKMVSYSEDKKEWESLSTVPTYLDSDGNTVTSPTSNLSNVSSVKFTAVGTHFSAYALSAATGVTPPDTPSGLTATVGNAVGGAVALTWGTVSTAEGYYIYRDTSSTGSFALLVDASGASTASYSDSFVTAGTTYYYKVAAYKSSGSSESAASSAVSATVKSAGGGGSPGASGGGGGGASFGPPPRTQKFYPDGTKVYLDEPGAAAKIKELDAKFAKQVSAAAALAVTTAAADKTAPATAVAEASAIARAVSPVFNKDLVRGARSDDVKRLQELLGVEQSGFFGPLTEKALKAFQVKYGVVKSGLSAGAGKLGPATRAKVAEVFASAISVAPSAEAVTEAVTRAAAAVPEITRRLAAGSRGDDVKVLQEFLASDKNVYPEGEATGFFGALTRKAVQRFQEKYGIAKPGIEGYGDVGPATRAKLSELRKAGATMPVSPSVTTETSAQTEGSSAKAALEKQISDAMKQLEMIQKQLNDVLKKP